MPQPPNIPADSLPIPQFSPLKKGKSKDMLSPPVAFQPLASTYHVKEILFPDTPTQDKRIRILCQNENGPCPLLVICNILLLRGQFRLPLCESITYADLASELGNYVVNHCPEHMNLDTILEWIPQLTRGVDVNIQFHSILALDTPDTPALALFRACDIDLVHGWVVDPQDQQTWAVLGPHGPAPSYNEATVLATASSAEGAVANEFLTVTANQLTAHGLILLATQLQPLRLYALFRNNHFSVLYRRGAGEVYCLVSDLGYRDHAAVVWETLVSIDGDCVFVDGEFHPVDVRQPWAEVPGPPGGQTQETLDYDHALAMSMQEREDHATRDTGEPKDTAELNFKSIQEKCLLM
jgi:hypothetical protein